MAKKKILSVEFEIPGGGVECSRFKSKRSLLDADIVVFEPTLGSYHSSSTYQGKTLLSEDDSFRARESLRFWKSELEMAFETGKVIFVFLVAPREAYAHTGEKQYSGTGRNRHRTTTVSLISSYLSLPPDLEIQVRSGTSIIPAGSLGYLATYWKEFADYSSYAVNLQGKFSDVLLKTKSGNKIVGASVRSEKGGAMVLLPPIPYDIDQFTRYDEATDEVVWTAEAIAFGKRLIACLVGAANALRSELNITPPPEWTQRSEYRLPQEDVLEKGIRAKARQIEKLQRQTLELEQKLQREGGLRRLLYEQGHQLEEAILEALNLLGFEAEPYIDSESEFDAVFTSPEGRFLGEAEGKDNRCINIDKLSQLERNLQEDFAKENVTEFAKGVLFGNVHRLILPEDRPTPFTGKCIAGAKRSKVALVQSSDLFQPARYLKQNDDLEYARQCRGVIFRSEGEVTKFPDVPIADETISIIAEENSDSVGAEEESKSAG